MNLIILTDTDRLDSSHFRISDHRFEHVRSVLKLEVGDTVEVGLLNGDRGRAVIEEFTKHEIVLKIDSLEPVPPSKPNLDLICALPRPQTLKKVLQTCGMMGVRRLFLIRADRVERSYYQSPLLEPENYTKYLIEGLSQGKLTRSPEVHIFERFRPFIEDTLPRLESESEGSPVKLLPDPTADKSLARVLDKVPDNVMLAVGPEGGWVDFELEAMAGAGFTLFSLGQSILRVETAVTASLAQLELVKMILQQK